VAAFALRYSPKLTIPFMIELGLPVVWSQSGLALAILIILRHGNSARQLDKRRAISPLGRGLADGEARGGLSGDGDRPSPSAGTTAG